MRRHCIAMMRRSCGRQAPNLQQNEFLWTKFISEHNKLGQATVALRIYDDMLNEGIMPSTYTFVAVLKACGAVTDLEAGKAVHAHVIESGNQSNVFVATALVDMYGKCGSMANARQVFEDMKHRTVVSWKTMIMGYAQMEMGDSALQLYARMQDEGFTPDDHTFIAALKACGSLATHEEATEITKLRCLEKGRAIHSQVANSGFESNIYVASTLVDMYAKCGCMVDALQVFEQMPRRDVVSWTALIIGYANTKNADLGLQLYARMQQEGLTPNAYTFVAALKACGSLAALEQGKEVDGELIKIRSLEKGRAIHFEAANSGLECNLFVASTLVDMYVKCGSMVDARHVFEKMPHRDLVSWTAMIVGYVQMEKGGLALKLYARMQDEGFTPNTYIFVAALKACSSLAASEEANEVDGELIKKRCLEKGKVIHSKIVQSGLEYNVFVASTLVDMYVKCGSMVDACQVFEKMPHRDVVSWTAMIAGYAQMEKGNTALQLYARMQYEGCKPNAHTFAAVLKACGSLASLEMGTKIHEEISKGGLEGESFLATCLIDMYSKCGSMVDAQRLFDAFAVRDAVTWNVLIAGYSGQGDSGYVFHLFERMQQDRVQPDGITFVSVLTVCSHTGLVEEGKRYFQSMCSDYGIIPHSKHYSCMVDLLGRAGELDEAVAMVKKMPFEPVIVTWMAILGACRKWNNLELGRHAFECSVKLDGKCAASYVLMTKMCVFPCVGGEC